MPFRRFKLDTLLIGATATILGGSTFVANRHDVAETPTPVLEAARAVVAASPTTFVTGGAPASADAPAKAGSKLAAEVATALGALQGSVTQLSRPEALEDAFKSYYAFKAAHPEQVRKPYLYFVDYGLSSTTPRGYVFDMEQHALVDGPFTVAHGRGSGPKNGVPTRFANEPGAATTSLGLYLTQETYAFVGHASGTVYRSVGLRLKGLSGDFNDKARDRGVVAHGAPYVTKSGSGRSEGCPAVEPARAERLLPKLANGSLVFLFAPNEQWLANDPWLAANNG